MPQLQLMMQHELENVMKMFINCWIVIVIRRRIWMNILHLLMYIFWCFNYFLLLVIICCNYIPQLLLILKQQAKPEKYSIKFGHYSSDILAYVCVYANPSRREVCIMMMTMMSLDEPLIRHLPRMRWVTSRQFPVVFGFKAHIINIVMHP